MKDRVSAASRAKLVLLVRGAVVVVCRSDEEQVSGRCSPCTEPLPCIVYRIARCVNITWRVCRASSTADKLKGLVSTLG